MNQVTLLLNRVSSGDHEAIDALMQAVYDELHGLASHYLRSESPGHTLQATALVHEAYLRLVDRPNQTWQNRAHFFASAATAIRRILVEHARRRRRLKRGGDMSRISLDEALEQASLDDEQIVNLDDSLSRLAGIDAEKARIVELRFFAGLTVDEAASVMGVSPSTVARGWRMARAWLRTDLERSGIDGN